MVALNDIKARRDEIIRICESHGGHNVRVFGSVARGDATEDSDIDFLIHLDSDRSLIDQVAMIRKLQELLGHKVDVVPDSSLHRIIRDEVLLEAKPL